jgi:uncharacterized membrane protein
MCRLGGKKAFLPVKIMNTLILLCSILLKDFDREKEEKIDYISVIFRIILFQIIVKLFL